MVYIKSNSEQTLLLPTDLRTIIQKDHICFLIEEVVNQIDFQEFDEKVKGPGNPSYHPRINLKIILNGVCERITSSRKLEKQTMENVVFRYLSENLSPDFHTIAMFRKENHDLIKKCFLQTVEIAKKLNMVNLNKLYLDGMKVKANASKSKTFTKEEIDFLSEFVDKQFEETEIVDKEEDKKYGDSNGEIKIPEHLTHKRKLQEKVKEVLEDIGKAKEKIDRAKEKICQEGVDEVNLTDMDSKMMKMKKGIHYEQAYNCQMLIEDKSEIIVGNHISDSPTDIWETEPTMEKFKKDQNVSLKDVEVFQDNGYSCSSTAEYYEKEGAIAYIPDPATTKELHGKAYEITKFDSDNFQLDFEKNQAICPAGHRMDFARKQIDKKTGNWTNVYKTRKCKNCGFKDECGRGKYGYRYIEINPLMRKIRLRFKTKEGVEKYNKRFHKGEVAQAHIEHNLGYREFKCRGNKMCENEVNLFSTAYNLIKIYKKWKGNGRNLEASLKNILCVKIYSYFLRIITQPAKRTALK